MSTVQTTTPVILRILNSVGCKIVKSHSIFPSQILMLLLEIRLSSVKRTKMGQSHATERHVAPLAMITTVYRKTGSTTSNDNNCLQEDM